MGKRPGKYAHLTAMLPRLSTIAPERYDIVDAVKQEILTSVAKSDDTTNILRILDRMDMHILDLLITLKRLTGGQRRVSTLASAYALARLVEEKIDSFRANAQAVLDAYESLMIEQMDAEKVASLRLADGSSVSTFLEPYAVVKDSAALREWCMKDPDLVKKMTLMWTSINALNKERLLAGEAPPPGVETWARPIVRLDPG